MREISFRRNKAKTDTNLINEIISISLPTKGNITIVQFSDNTYSVDIHPHTDNGLKICVYTDEQIKRKIVCRGKPEEFIAQVFNEYWERNKDA